MTDQSDPTEAETKVPYHGQILASGDHAEAAQYPRMFNLSAGLAFRAVLRAQVPDLPEYVTVPAAGDDIHGLAMTGAIARWNTLWEAAQFRRRLFDMEELPSPLAEVADRGDVNVIFIPRTRSRYYEYAPLFHLLPRAILERFGLPKLLGGAWPFTAELGDVDPYLPTDFEKRLAQAWAANIWRHLVPGSPISAFSKNETIRLLAHNLDFWVPPITGVMLEILRDLPVVSSDVEEGGPVRLVDGSTLPGAVLAPPRQGSDLWRGEAEAAEITAWTIEQADADGRLRAILDAVKSSRVQDDFSDRWSFAREDFERKLYRKRAKVKVRFVELTDTIPVQGPETEVEGQMVYSDFLALLDPQDRQIVVVLISGTTKLTEVAQILGYSNHSAVSKRLKRIREQAARYFEE